LLRRFENDGVYDDDDHLPLPEERAPLEKVRTRPADAPFVKDKWPGPLMHPV
jgi:hypothetical protein